MLSLYQGQKGADDDSNSDDNNNSKDADDDGADGDSDNNGVVNMGGDINSLALAMGVRAYIFGNFLV